MIPRLACTKENLENLKWHILTNQEIVANLPELLRIFLTNVLEMTLDDTLENAIKLTVESRMEK